MDHENYPVALPSGQIYSISGLKSTSINNKFYCMITETWYDKEEAIKIYLTWKINDTCWINYLENRDNEIWIIIFRWCRLPRLEGFRRLCFIFLFFRFFISARVFGGSSLESFIWWIVGNEMLLQGWQCILPSLRQLGDFRRLLFSLQVQWYHQFQDMSIHKDLCMRFGFNSSISQVRLVYHYLLVLIGKLAWNWWLYKPHQKRVSRLSIVYMLYWLRGLICRVGYRRWLIILEFVWFLLSIWWYIIFFRGRYLPKIPKYLKVIPTNLPITWVSYVNFLRSYWEYSVSSPRWQLPFCIHKLFCCIYRQLYLISQILPKNSW